LAIEARDSRRSIAASPGNDARRAQMSVAMLPDAAQAAPDNAFGARKRSPNNAAGLRLAARAKVANQARAPVPLLERRAPRACRALQRPRTSGPILAAIMKSPRRAAATAALVCLAVFSWPARSQVTEPDGAGVRPGTLPLSWQPSGPRCADKSDFQVHAYNDDLYILRESGCSNYEKPFLYLFFGKDKALLLDTGAGKTDVDQVVMTVVDGWLKRNGRDSIALVVAHTHAHGDHIAGDSQLRQLPRTTVVEPNPAAVQAFFGLRNWPLDTASYDLGQRILDVIPIPGHEPSSIAIYDRETATLFTGDTLYPGRLYVRDAAAFTLSVQRLVDFTHGKTIAHVLGNHVEQTRTPYLDYPVGTIYQPDEHPLELGRAHLLELNEALREMHGKVYRLAFRDFTIWPK
jgi:hydroxyacylglutathione hydrolase